MTGDARAFREDVWASSRHLHDLGPDRARGLLSLSDVDTLVTASGLRTPSIRVVQDGTIVPSARYTRSASIAGQPLTGLVDARKVVALAAGGATVVLQGLHRHWPPITALVAQLERELGHPVQCNAYLTPAGSQGFAPHVDTHDVFVVQTEGDKAWRIGEEGAEEDLVLTPGTVLYLPSGTRHSARSQDTLSLHLTIGINQVTWRQLVRRSLSHVLAAVPDTHLPVGHLDDPSLLVAGLTEHLGVVATRVAELDPSALAREHAVDFLTSRPPRLGGRLAAALQREEICDDTLLRRRPGSVALLTDGLDASTVRLLLGDRSIAAPAWLRPALISLLDRTEFRAEDLTPLLDPQSRLVLCRRLAREGLLEVAPLDPSPSTRS